MTRIVKGYEYRVTSAEPGAIRSANTADVICLTPPPMGFSDAASAAKALYPDRDLRLVWYTGEKTLALPGDAEEPVVHVKERRRNIDLGD